MNLIFVTEARFIKDKFGNIFSSDGSFSYWLWKRYLCEFDRIYVFARVKYVFNHSFNFNTLSSGLNVQFIECPYYEGPLGFLRKYCSIRRVVNKAVNNVEGVYLLRIPGYLSEIFISKLRKNNIKYGVEVVGDPWDVFAPGSLRHPLRSFLRYKGYLGLKFQVRYAVAVLYVTKFTLQSRYPATTDVYTTNVSDVEIREENIALKSKMLMLKHHFQIISVGSLEQLYKAPDLLISAIKDLNQSGINCSLIWLGDGKYKSEMEALVKQYGLEGKIKFVGQVSSKLVNEYLELSDLFVLVSRTEGLPRAMIEAMAKGLPCIGTNVGGIPELLENDMLIRKDDKEDLVYKIRRVFSEPKLYDYQASRNLQEANNYISDSLMKRRLLFYKKLQELN